jgi:hypothetical protein
MIRDFALIMLGIAIQIFTTWLVCKFKYKTHEIFSPPNNS